MCFLERPWKAPSTYALKIQDQTIALEFEDGYEKLTEPFEQVEGNITIEGVDFDCTCVMLQSKWGNYGKFNGEKLELEHFIKRYKNYSFEIVNELYGYNQVFILVIYLS